MEVEVRSEALVSADVRRVRGTALAGEGNLTVVGRVDDVDGCLSSKVTGRIEDEEGRGSLVSASNS